MSDQAADMIFDAFSTFNNRRPDIGEMLQAIADGKNPNPGHFGPKEDTDADSR